MGIRERLVRILEKKNPESKIVKSFSYQGDAPEVSFKQLMDYYERTPQVSIGVTGYSELITGTDLQINADDDNAKEFIEEWNRKTNFYDKLENMVTTFLVCGNSILEKLDERNIEDVSEVDMSTIMGKKRDEYGNTLYYIQNVGGQNITLGKESLDRFIEFNLSMYSRKEWSPSLFQSIAIPRTVRDRAYLPLVESLWAIEDAMSAIILNNAYPEVYYTFEGANETELEKEAQKIKKRKPGDKFIGTRKPQIDIFETQPNSKYTDYINHIEKAIQLGIKFPHDIMTGDFTSRAASDTTEDLTTKIARGIQRYITNKLKIELYDVILKQNGYDPMKANLTVSFTTQNIIHLTPDQVSNRVSTGMWTKDEGREWDKDNLGADLFDDDKINDDLMPVPDKQGGVSMKPRIIKNIKKENYKEGFGERLVYKLDYGHIKEDVCDDYADEVYEYGSSDIPQIPDDTHPNCNCYFEDEETGEYLGQDPSSALGYESARIKKEIESIKSNLIKITEVMKNKVRSESAKEQILSEINKIQSKIDENTTEQKQKRLLLEARQKEILDKLGEELDHV